MKDPRSHSGKTLISKTCIAIYLAVYLSGPMPSFGQFYEDFADSNFTTNPTWLGDTAKFIVNSQRELQLNAAANSGSALLRTPSFAVHQGRWEFYGRMDFNPSSVNLLELYLMATDSAPHLSGSGYGIRLGGPNDNIEFIRCINGTITRLASWANGWLNKEINPFAIKVERYTGGIWYCYADTSNSVPGTTSWIWLGTVTDNTIRQSSQVVLRPVYTSTRSRLFNFKRITVSGTLMPDSVPPYVNGFQFVSANTLNVIFSEPLDTLHASSNMAIQHHISMSCNGYRWKNDTVLEILYSGTIPREQWLPLRLSGLQDRSGLPLDTVLELLLNEYRPGRVRISEFMSDPDPPKKAFPDGLPISEFVEIYNPDSLPVRLLGCSLGDATTISWLPPYTLQPQAYAVLVPSELKELWEQWSDSQVPRVQRNFIGLHPWPSLNNDQDKIRFVGPEGSGLDSIAYQLDWWTTIPQRQGGWSLSRQQLLCPCQDSLNWKPSTHAQGGDPGVGSVPFMDSTAGCSKAANILATQLLVDPNLGFRLQFDSPVRPSQRARIALIINGDTIGIPVNKADTLRLLREWALITGLAQSLVPGKLYTMLCEGWETCNGLMSPPQFLAAGLGIEPDSALVMISEIYPRPLHTDYPWVECCNLSKSVLDRSRLWLFRTGQEGEILEGNSLGQELEPWFPGQCLLLSRNKDFLRLEGLRKCPLQSNDSLRQDPIILNLPALPRTGAWLSLQDHQGRTLDRVAYHDSCFHPWAGNIEGKSLQRWPYDRPYIGQGLPPTRWLSSSTQERASPGCFVAEQNQGLPPQVPTSKRGRNSPVALTLSQEILVPTALDGIRIGLTFQEPAINNRARVNLRIMDLFGGIIAYLSHDEWADPDSAWFWDGRTGSASKRPSGIMVPDGAYPVVLEWQNAEGQSGWDLTEIHVLRSP
jgi:hypothetical protein